MSQGRVPSGVPTGGQFVAGSRSEQPSQLDPTSASQEPELGRMDEGTYKYPPAFANVDQAIDFYLNVHISEERLDHVQRAYVEEYRRELGEALDQWERVNPEPFGNPAKLQEWEQRREAFVHSVDLGRPAVISTSSMRPFVRLMWIDEVQRGFAKLGHEVDFDREFRQADGQMLNAAHIVEYYKLDRPAVGLALIEELPDRGAQRVVAAIDQLRSELDSGIDDLHDAQQNAAALTTMSPKEYERWAASRGY